MGRGGSEKSIVGFEPSLEPGVFTVQTHAQDVNVGRMTTAAPQVGPVGRGCLSESMLLPTPARATLKYSAS